MNATTVPCLLYLGTVSPDLAASPWGPFELRRCASLDDVAAILQTQACDGLLVVTETLNDAQRLVHWPALSQAVLDAAMIVVTPEAAPELARRLLQLGVQDVVPAADADTPTLGRSLGLALERKTLERAARKAYATDLATGLPNHMQLLEHMTHILALREREPAPMALLVVRIEGLATTEARLGAESANVLRRKVAVRLRSALRASDVVASIGADSFAVLLAWIDSPNDGARVAGKLAQTLQRSFRITGHEVAVAVSVGVSLYPEHGKDADSLLRRATGQAAGMAAVGRAGFANLIERGPGSAANDDEG